MNNAATINAARTNEMTPIRRQRLEESLVKTQADLASLIIETDGMPERLQATQDRRREIAIMTRDIEWLREKLAR